MKKQKRKNFYTAEKLEYMRMHRKVQKVDRIKLRWRGYGYFDKARGYDICDYSYEELKELLTVGQCTYCASKEKLGLDRIDNSKGHTKNNTVIACAKCNSMRNCHWSVDEFRKVWELTKKLRGL